MKKHLLVFSLLMLLSSFGFSQILVDYSYKKVEKILQKHFKNNSVVVTKTDTNLIYLLRDSAYKHLDMYFSFNKDQKCTFQKVSFDCDSCYHKFLKSVMKTPFMDWKSIAPGQYVSRDWLHSFLVTDDKNFTYTITWVNYSRKEYEQLIKKKND